MKLWEILKGIEEGTVKKGDQFRDISVQCFSIEIEYTGHELVYSKSMSDTTTRNTVVLSGEIYGEYEKIDKKCSQCGQIIKE